MRLPRGEAIEAPPGGRRRNPGVHRMQVHRHRFVRPHPPCRKTPARKIPEQNFRIGRSSEARQVSCGMLAVIAIAMSDRPPYTIL
jgi:hypothetical protein